MVLRLGKELCFSYLNCNLLLINIKLHVIVRLLAEVVAHLQPSSYFHLTKIERSSIAS